MFVDTNVWSLAFRQDSLPDLPEVQELGRSLDAGTVYCTGLVRHDLTLLTTDKDSQNIRSVVPLSVWYPWKGSSGTCTSSLIELLSRGG